MIKRIAAILVIIMFLSGCDLGPPCKPAGPNSNHPGCCTAGFSGKWCCEIDGNWKCW